MPVGNAGNANDTADGDAFTGGIQNYGAVAYDFSIAKYDVTNSQYAEFLNLKDPTGGSSLALYTIDMAGALGGGIDFTPNNPVGSRYTLVAGRNNHPVNGVTWYDAARFANWVNNGQGSADTEMGAYTFGPLGPGGIPTNGLAVTRNAGAQVFLPNDNEWYKAAYYDSATHSYFQYPTSSNVAPTSSVPTGLVNSANIAFSGPGAPVNVAHTAEPQAHTAHLTWAATWLNGTKV